MKPEFDDPTFTAWLLGEATQEEAAAWEQRLREDEALQRERAEAQSFVSALEQTMSQSVPMLDLGQREKVLSLARSRDLSQHLPTLPPAPRRKWSAWVLATAAMVTMGVWLGLQYPSRSGEGVLSYQQVTREIALLPSDDGGFPDGTGEQERALTVAGGGSPQAQREEMWHQQASEFLRLVAQRVAEEPIPEARELPMARSRNFVDSRKHPVASLPTRIGVSSWSWTKRSILEKGRKPAAPLVRVEEWIQAFPLQKGSRSSVDGLLLRTVVATPVAGSEAQRLILLSLTNTSHSAKKVEWSYRSPSSCRYRLVGFDAASRGRSDVARALGPGECLQVMIEIKDAAASADLGEVIGRSGGKPLKWQLSALDNASDEAEFYQLLTLIAADFRGQAVDRAMVRSLLEKQELLHLSPDRAEAVSLMKRWF